MAPEDPGQTDFGHRRRGPSLILYLDTSALLKDYLEEEGAAVVREAIARASRLATSVITYVEARSALARRRHAGDLSAAEYRHVVRRLDDAWERLLRLDVSDGLLGEAARLAEKHVLRAYDAIHLGSAVLLRSQLGTDITLASWDDELDAAAARERFTVLRARRR